MSKVEKAITVLEDHITAIHTVSEWAESMGFDSPATFPGK